MSTRKITCHTLHCDVAGCVASLKDEEHGGTLVYDTTEQLLAAAKGYDWTVTDKAISYGPRIVERFAVCPEGDSDHDEARGLIIEVPETVAALLGEEQR